MAEHLAYHVEAAVVYEGYPADTAAVALVRRDVRMLLCKSEILIYFDILILMTEFYFYLLMAEYLSVIF